MLVGGTATVQPVGQRAGLLFLVRCGLVCSGGHGVWEPAHQERTRRSSAAASLQKQRFPASNMAALHPGQPSPASSLLRITAAPRSQQCAPVALPTGPLRRRTIAANGRGYQRARAALTRAEFVELAGREYVFAGMGTWSGSLGANNLGMIPSR
ncbi:hypothetical protein PtA15_14A403 [Puccinia triticina]|uniref:Uncharacterized protein n=1 Tax=Puccinia triticina TaxID=208348 RepID=A0ABY7D1R1_9BASI|nr:uncharacterized protein PtA15_14A403 [Puccinia triticina]WAQ91519.1 hypothetical protein PtA15_14A403 [Puccinia triticina]